MLFFFFSEHAKRKLLFLKHVTFKDNHLQSLWIFTENACLKGHNDRRALHGADPLVWNDTLVQRAQVWADHLAANNIIEHDPNLNGEGENIAFFQGRDSADCADALIGW